MILVNEHEWWTRRVWSNLCNQCHQGWLELVSVLECSYVVIVMVWCWSLETMFQGSYEQKVFNRWRSHNTIASGSLTHTPNFGYTNAILPQIMKILDLLILKWHSSFLLFNYLPTCKAKKIWNSLVNGKFTIHPQHPSLSGLIHR